MLDEAFFQQDPVTCATRLIGCEFRWDGCSGIVVETEAYWEVGDEACHTFFRPSTRRFVEEHPAGTAYVYLNYGMYWLTNVLVKAPRGSGFVLLRALKPESGIEIMQTRRSKQNVRDLCSGPGKLSMALGIAGGHHGQSFVEDPARGFHLGDAARNLTPSHIVADARIGISRAQEHPWRFTLRDSGFVSVKPKSVARKA